MVHVTNKYQDIQLHVMYMYMIHVTTVVHTFISILRYVDFYSIYTMSPYKVSTIHAMYTNIYYPLSWKFLHRKFEPVHLTH